MKTSARPASAHAMLVLVAVLVGSGWLLQAQSLRSGAPSRPQRPNARWIIHQQRQCCPRQRPSQRPCDLPGGASASSSALTVTSCSPSEGESELFFAGSGAGKETVSGSLAITRVAAALNSVQYQREVMEGPVKQQQPAESTPMHMGGVCATFMGPKVAPPTP